MKGAPERILDRCSTYHMAGKDWDVDADFEKKYNKAYLTMGGLGERVLGW